MSSTNGIPTATEMPCTLSREDIITRVSLLAEIHVRAMMSSMELEEFAGVAEFPAEIIACTPNGYQRLLSETANQTVVKLAGFILRFKAALKYELGVGVLQTLEKEHITIAGGDLAKLEGGDKEALTLWSTAYPTAREIGVSGRYDVISTFLFINHVKWLTIRMQAEGDEPKKEQKK